MKKLLLAILFLISLFSQLSSAQYRDESYEDLTSTKSYFIIGYLKTNHDFPVRFGNENKGYGGFVLGSRYNVRTLEDIEIGKFAKARLNIGGGFDLGMTFGSDSLRLPDEIQGTTETISSYKTKTYNGVADLFKLNINLEYFLILPKKRSLELSLALTFFNIGGSLTYFDSPGSFMDKKMSYTLNFLPLYIEPSAKIRFRGATLGIGLLINPYSFVEYRGGPGGYYGFDEEGVKGGSANPTKYAVNLYLNF